MRLGDLTAAALPREYRLLKDLPKVAFDSLMRFSRMSKYKYQHRIDTNLQKSIEKRLVALEVAPSRGGRSNRGRAALKAQVNPIFDAVTLAPTFST